MKKLFSLVLISILLLTAAAPALAEGTANVQVGDYLVFGHYEQDGNRINGREPVEWQVLEVKDGKALIITRYGLDVYEYDKRVP